MKYKVVAGILISFYVLIACRGNYDTNEVMNFPVVDTIGLDSSILEVSVVAENLDVPWEIAWGPENSIFISEQSGTVSRLDLKTGKKQQLLKIDEVWRKRTTGMLGMVLHPDMAKHPYVFVDYTLRKGKDSAMFTKLVRYTLKDDTLTNAKVLLEIEGNTSHNGSRLAFSKSGKIRLLYLVKF
jgi:glucose/arabinose dehydrogenase